MKQEKTCISHEYCAYRGNDGRCDFPKHCNYQEEFENLEEFIKYLYEIRLEPDKLLCVIERERQKQRVKETELKNENL